MKLSIATFALALSGAAAFAPAAQFSRVSSMVLNSEASVDAEIEEIEEPPAPPPAPKDPFDTPKDLPGVAGPLGFFDPLDFSANADGATMKRYREAELTHGRVGMLAVLGFLAGEFVEGSSFLFDAQVSGPAISHLEQIPNIFWIILTVGIGASETKRLNIGWVDPAEVPVAQAGLLRVDYVPGDIGFDPLGLKPSDAAGLKNMQTKELQNGRLAMLAAAGCMAQELVNGKGILENLGVTAHLG